MAIRALVLASLFVWSPCYAAEIVDSVSDETVAPVIAELAAAPDYGRVDITINSPGGDVGAGMTLIDAMRAAKRRGIGIVCIVDGQASSMAAYLLQICSVRVVRAGSFILFHAPRSQYSGTAWEIERQAQALNDYQRIFAIMATGRMHMSVAEFEARIKDKDWILSPAEALAIGAVDLVTK